MLFCGWDEGLVSKRNQWHWLLTTLSSGVHPKGISAGPSAGLQIFWSVSLFERHNMNSTKMNQTERRIFRNKGIKRLVGILLLFLLCMSPHTHRHRTESPEVRIQSNTPRNEPDENSLRTHLDRHSIILLFTTGSPNLNTRLKISRVWVMCRNNLLLLFFYRYYYCFKINETALKRPPWTSTVHLFFLEASSVLNSF